MKAEEVIEAWDQADPKAIHPTRHVSEEAYWQSGRDQAETLALDIPKDSVVVDFGCGDGRVAIPMLELGYQVLGVDASPNMLNRFRDEATKQAFAPAISDPASFSDAGQEFDALYCLAVLIHQDYETAREMLQLMVRSVRPGGILCLDWPTSLQPHERSHWIDVTTWDEEAHELYSNELGLVRVDVQRPWFVFRKEEVA